LFHVGKEVGPGVGGLNFPKTVGLDVVGYFVGLLVGCPVGFDDDGFIEGCDEG
jgi:hypothetical protein